MDEVKGTFKLSKPIKVDDKEISEVHYDFDAIPTSAIRDVMTILGKQGYVVLVAGNDIVYNFHMFVKATDLHPHDAMQMGVKDQMRAANLSINFFNADSEE